jgi:CrcB protein
MERLFWICLAGALGTGTRHLISVWAGERFGFAFPYGTLIVNVVGCFLIGVVAQTTLNVSTISPALRLALMTGFLGGLTTYSSFALETVRLAQEGARRAAVANLALTTVGCFVAVVLGLLAANALTRS